LSPAPAFAYPLTDSQTAKLQVPVAELPTAKKGSLILMGIRLPETTAGDPAETDGETPQTSPLKPRP